MFRSLIVALTLCALIGCTSMRALEAPLPASIQERVAPGKRVAIDTRSGRHLELEVISVSADTLIGRAEDGRRWTVPLAQIERIDVESFSGWKTSGATLVAVVAALAAVIFLGGRAIEKELDGD